jgi:hypothetical protein
MKRIYLCAQFKEQELMKEWRRLLHNAGHVVMSRWLDKLPSNDKVAGANEATMDLIDIDIAEYVISHTLSRGDLFTGGGRHVEFGYALARHKNLINVGGYESVFHYLSQVKTVKTIEEAIACLT